jgi:hypothetical protein
MRTPDDVDRLPSKLLDKTAAEYKDAAEFWQREWEKLRIAALAFMDCDAGTFFPTQTELRKLCADKPGNTKEGKQS